MTNWKIYKITGKSEYSSESQNMFLRFDKWIDYGNWSGEYISVVNRLPFTSYQVGDYVEIDLDKTISIGGGDFDTNVVRKVSLSEVATRNAMINASLSNSTTLAVV